jgi:membrane protein implicated in regulation of membrane protease activity
MSGWVLWMIAAAVFGIGEMLTTSFFLAPFSVGALLAGIVDLAGAGEIVSWVVFVVVSLLVLGIVRPIARAHLKTPPELRTGTAALVGMNATVLEEINNHEGVGCVKIEGEVWTARAYDEDEVIPQGKRVQVIEIRGATALVSE